MSMSSSWSTVSMATSHVPAPDQLSSAAWKRASSVATSPRLDWATALSVFAAGMLTTSKVPGDEIEGEMSALTLDMLVSGPPLAETELPADSTLGVAICQRSRNSTLGNSACLIFW